MNQLRLKPNYNMLKNANKLLIIAFVLLTWCAALPAMAQETEATVKGFLDPESAKRVAQFR